LSGRFVVRYEFPVTGEQSLGCVLQPPIGSGGPELQLDAAFVFLHLHLAEAVGADGSDGGEQNNDPTPLPQYLEVRLYFHNPLLNGGQSNCTIAAAFGQNDIYFEV
jgi:hypothetical protein